MLKHHSKFNLIVLLVICLGAAALIVKVWEVGMWESEILNLLSFNVIKQAVVIAPRQKPPQQTVKGLYLTAYSASSLNKVDQIIKLINSTELNAVVIDIKDYTGYVLYNSKIPLVNKLKTKRAIIKDLSAIVKKFHANKIYVIARQTVFQDPVLAAAKPEWAIKNKSGGLWRDNKGLSWVDPTFKEVWNYNLIIAREAINLGFDEINFDYVRFPSDGNIAAMRFTNLTKPKYKVMADFYKYVGQKLKDAPAWLSLDMFGLSLEATGAQDMNIGQRVADAVDSVDYISPMMYPSHYPPGHLGLKNPAKNPALVISYGLKLGLPKFVNKRAKVRPWIQAFNMGAIYDAAKIRAQINEIEKVSDAGWMMWNASNRYSAAGLENK